VDQALELVTHLLDLQSSILMAQKVIFDELDLNDLKVSAFIPLVQDSYDIYKLVVWLLKQLVESIFSFSRAPFSSLLFFFKN